MSDPNQDNQDKSGDSVGKSWREELKDESLRTNKSLEKFVDKDALAKSYVELEGKLGKSVEIPQDEADAGALDKYYARVRGVKTPEEYDLAAVKDEGFKKFLAENGYKAGMDRRQLKQMADAIQNREADREKAAKEANDKRYSDAEAKLKAKYGDKYAEVPAKAAKAFAKMFGSKPELFERLKAAGLDNDPDMVEQFAEFASVLEPETNLVKSDSGKGGAKDDEDLSWMYQRYGGAPTPGRT